MKQIEDMRACVEAYRNFGECSVQEVSWVDSGTTIAIIFDYIWNPDGMLRQTNEDRFLVRLCFRIVQEFHLDNALRPALLEDLSALDWSFSEVAQALFLDDATPGRYDSLPLRFPSRDHSSRRSNVDGYSVRRA
jgi:hypothetical protein